MPVVVFQNIIIRILVNFKVLPKNYLLESKVTTFINYYKRATLNSGSAVGRSDLQQIHYILFDN